MAIIPTRRTAGEMFATGLGSGIGSGLQMLAKKKIEQLGAQGLVDSLFGQQQGQQQGADMSFLSDADKKSIGVALQINRPDLIPSIISKSQATAAKGSREQQRILERRYKPEIDAIQKGSIVAEKALPVIQQMKQMVDQIPTGLGKSLGRLWGNDAIMQYQQLAEQLEGITGIKSGGLPPVSTSPKAMKNQLNRLISEYSKPLMKRDALNDIFAENNNTIPKDFSKQIDRRLKLRTHQQKKNINDTDPSRFMPIQQEQAQQADMVANQGTGGGPEPIQEERPVSEFPEGTPVFGARDESYAEKLGDLMGTDVLGGPMSRVVSKGISGALGGIGSTVEGLTGLGSLLTGGLIPRTSLGLPTTEAVQRKLFGGRVSESKAEEIIGNVVKEAAELVAPGAALSTAGKAIGALSKVPKWLKTAESFLKISPKAAAAISTAGNGAAAALEKAGAPKPVQELGKLITSLGASALTGRFAQVKSKSIAKSIEKSVENAKPYTSYRLRDNLHALWGNLNKGEKTAFKNNLMKQIESIESIKMDPKKLWDIRNTLEQAKSAPGVSRVAKDYIPKLINQVDRGIGHANKPLRNLINDYRGLSKAKDATSKIHQSLKILTKRNPLITAVLWSVGLRSKPKLIASLGLGGIGGIGLFGELEKSLKLMNNPAFQRRYGDLVKAGIIAAGKQLGTTKTE